MKRITFQFLFLVLAISCFQGLLGQNFSPSKGCFKAAATLTQGDVLSQGGGRAHVHGFAEYFLNKKISLSGDVFFHAVQLPVSANWIHREAHGLFLGGYYHWTHRGHDIICWISIRPSNGLCRLFKGACRSPASAARFSCIHSFRLYLLFQSLVSLFYSAPFHVCTIGQ